MHHNKIAMLRKTWGLSQPDLAALLGVSRATVSRLEAGALPLIVTALTFEALFDIPVSAIFPQQYVVAVDALVPRLAEFSKRIEGKLDGQSERKRQLLSGFAGRDQLPA
jgi:DNA-binding XRE family transcriptional regulator